MHSLTHSVLSAILLTAFASAVPAQEQRFDIGIRLGITAADGEPANDIPGAGILAHYLVNDSWTIGAALDRTEYDFEEPAKIAGITQESTLGPIDALAEATTLSIWIEHSLSEPARRSRFFVGAGLGAASVDVPDVGGPRADGGRFDIRTEADTEIVATVLGGVRHRFGSRWYGELALRADQHFADWRIVDRVSGARGSIGDYLAWGAHAAVGVRW